MLNTLDDINYSFNQTVEEMKLESLVNVHSKVTDCFSKNEMKQKLMIDECFKTASFFADMQIEAKTVEEMKLESLKNECSKVIGSFTDMQLEVKTAREMMIESLQDEYFRAMGTTDSFADLGRVNSQAVSIQEIKARDSLFSTIENPLESKLKMIESLATSSIIEESILDAKQHSIHSALSTINSIVNNAIGYDKPSIYEAFTTSSILEEEQNKIYSLMEEIKTPFATSLISKNESSFYQLAQEQLVESELSQLDAITRNALGSTIAGFNDDYNQITEAYLTNSENSQKELFEALARSVSFQNMKSQFEVLNEAYSVYPTNGR